MGKQNRTMAESNYISMAKTDTWKARTARVVIVGGGFGGLAAAKALRKAPVKVILIDRAVSNQFSTPRNFAETEEHHRDHGRGDRRGQGATLRFRQFGGSRTCAGRL